MKKAKAKVDRAEKDEGEVTYMLEAYDRHLGRLKQDHERGLLSLEALTSAIFVAGMEYARDALDVEVRMEWDVHLTTNALGGRMSERLKENRRLLREEIEHTRRVMTMAKVLDD